MKSIIKIPQIAAMLFSITLSVSCAALQIVSPPRLEERTLRIADDLPAFEYQYWDCGKKILGVCVKHVMRKELYDLRDAKVRKQLIDMGFVAQVREKP